MIHVGSIRDLCHLFAVKAPAIDADHDDILIALIQQNAQGNVIEAAAVPVPLTSQLFVLKRQKIGAGQQHILHRSLFTALDIHCQFLVLRHGIRHGKEFPI